MDLLKQQAVPRHGIDDPGHREQGPQEGHSQPGYGAHGHNVLCKHAAVHGKHLHERGVGVNLIVRNHQGQDHRDLRGRGMKTNAEIFIQQRALWWYSAWYSSGNIAYILQRGDECALSKSYLVFSKLNYRIFVLLLSKVYVQLYILLFWRPQWWY